jgi:hypothetical protein
MKVGNLVRYTSTGDALGTGIILDLCPRQTGADALVMWSGETRGIPIRWIDFKYIEAINESR